MADKSLSVVPFPIYGEEETEAYTPSGISKIRRVGFVTTRLSVVRYLNLEEKSVAFSYWKEKKESERSLALADGTNLESSKTSGAQAVKVAKGLYAANDVRARGSRTVILFTGNKIANTKRKKNKENARHQISFRFPAWVDTYGISDWLGTTIDNSKFNMDPGQSQIKPFFKVVGGRTYAIMSTADAQASSNIEPILTTQGVEIIKTKLDAQLIAKYGKQ